MWPFKKNKLRNIDPSLAKMANISSVEDLNDFVKKLDNISQKKGKIILAKASVQTSSKSPKEIKTIYTSLSADPHDETALKFFKKYNIHSPYNPLHHEKTKWQFYKSMDFSGLSNYNKNMKLYRKFHDHILHITMELKKGGKIMFFVNEIEDGFIYNEMQYIFDVDMRYPIRDTMNIEFGAYDYFEGFPLPVKHTFPINLTLKAFEDGLAGDEIAEINYACNPLLLLRFIKSDVIKKLFASVDEKGDWVFWIVCGIGVVVFIILVLSVINTVSTHNVSKAVELMGQNLQSLLTSLNTLIRK